MTSTSVLKRKGSKIQGSIGVNGSTPPTGLPSATSKVTSKASPDKKIAGFFPHSFQTEVKMAAGTQILVAKQAYEKMWHYVDICTDEIGWLGTAHIDEYGRYIIEDVFMFEQEVSATTTEISEDGLAKVAEELLAQEGGIETVNRLRFWGHSHVNMEVSPSPRDEEQMQDFRTSDHDWFIRGIMNKRGKMRFTIFIYSLGIRIEDPPWVVFDPVSDDRREEIAAEITEKVKKVAWGNAWKRSGGSTVYNYGRGGGSPHSPAPPGSSYVPAVGTEEEWNMWYVDEFGAMPQGAHGEYCG